MQYVWKFKLPGDNELKYGFTTGSCSAAAAKAATYMLLSGKRKEKININTPAGIEYQAEIEDISISENKVSCAVRKDGGDDPDITSGTLVYASVSYLDDCIVKESKAGITWNCEQGEDVIIAKNSCEHIIIDGGQGVGRVTRKGLDQPVGNAAINSVPRTMIKEAVAEIMELFDYDGFLKVLISVPEGEQLAAKTFNPRLGIEGGISIIGTSGIVEPMSTKAIVDTIKVELNQKHAEGNEYIIVSPGNYGREFMKNSYGFELDMAVKCSNFIGDTIDIVRELGFKGMLLTGHIGKLIKLAGGIMNTHSKEADCRMELMAVTALKAGASIDCVNHILDSLTTEEAFQCILDENIKDRFSEYLIEKIMFYLQKRAGDMQIDCIVYSNEYGLIAASDRVKEDIAEYITNIQ